MAAHSTVTYVEPNIIEQDWQARDASGNTMDDFERVPNPEDYCIAMNIEVEVSSRDSQGSIKDGNKEVLILQWSNSDKSTVSFMSGTKIGNYEYDGLNRKLGNVTGYQSLTTYYADMYVGDLIHYGTTEMIGIKSVNIEYAKSCVPIITVQFTDVRGLSLFQPTELSRDNTYNGIKGLNKDNVAQSFFQCFFKMPLPKFTFYIKGFYGNPVAYVCMCDKFDTNFNSDTGDFDVTARFIGYSYSFMTDISFDALLAAPYSDFEGKQYWEDQKANDRFWIWDKLKTHHMPMPTLYEIHKDYKELIKSSNEEMEHTTLTEEEKTHREEIEALNVIRGKYQIWYQQLYELLKEKYNKRYCFDFKNGTDENADWYRLLILANKTTEDKENLSSDYEQYSEDFKKTNNDLYAAIETFNESGYSYKKLKNISKDFSEYTRVKLFNDCYVNKNTRKVEFGGFVQENNMNRVQIVNRMFHNSMSSNDVKYNEIYKDYTLSTIYNDGIDQYKDAYVIEVDYSDIQRRIKVLTAHAKKSEDSKEKEKKRKEHNRIMLSKMNWYPSIENFTKIMMAHLETFMMMMYKIAEKCSDRKPEDVGVSVGKNGDACDVPEDAKILSPFPRVVKNEIGEDGITKTVDTWVGEYENGQSFIEADMINGLFNAVEHIQQLVKEEAEVEAEEQRIREGEIPRPNVKHPLTSFDFHLSKKIYGTDNDISNNANAFAGKIAMRMFDILSINSLRKQYYSKFSKTNAEFVKKIGQIEAENFYDNVKITNNNMLGLLGVEADKGTIDPTAILNCVIKGEGIGGNKEIPWLAAPTDDNLFSSDLWLSKYATSYSKTQKSYIYPMQNMSFDSLDETLRYFNKGVRSAQAKNNDIIVSWIDGDANAKAMLEASNDSCFGSIFISDDFKTVTKNLDEANSSADNIYKEVYDMLYPDAVFRPEIFAAMIHPEGVFRPKQGIITLDKGCKYTIDKNVEALVIHKDNNSNKMQCTDGQRVAYTFDRYKLDAYTSEAENGNINSWFLTECYGFDEDGDSLIISHDRSLIMQDSYQKNIDATSGWTYASAADKRMGFFVMGLEAIDYTTVAKHLNSFETFTYVPKLAVLQMGAALLSMKSINEKISSATLKNIPMPKSFTKIIDYLAKINYTTKLGYIKYFKDWVLKNNASINKNLLGTTTQIACEYVIGNLKRALFREDTDTMSTLTNNLMAPVLITKGNVNHFWGIKKNTLEIDESVAKSYLDGFLSRLRELYGIKAEDDKGGDAVKLVKDSAKTTEDMKKELYRYLKLVYDKWIPATDKKSWLFETFFNTEDEKTMQQEAHSDGHLFHFIDSFYNKIGDKLLINPRLLSEKLDAALQANDVNTMMLGFMADIYQQNKCMMMCLQNFLDLGGKDGGMKTMFKPIPYNEMPKPHKHPDFVVVYPYEPSKYLNVDNGEFNNDAFMLNDEFDTPLAVKSRGGNEDGYYRIPAFGVSYGKQYQSYFKKVSVGMANPIATQQVIQAKHAILRASQDTSTKSTAAQDLYDIYATQSYTCKVEMMGCAWIQPLMYFVLNNIPMFRGSYLIFKVNHKITPGNMVTEFQGTRMANVSNKLVEDIFTDEEYDTSSEPYLENRKYDNADVENDCQYKEFPLYEETSFESSASDLEKSKVVMDILIGYLPSDLSQEKKKLIAAGIAGNMFVESRFNPNSVNPRDKGSVAAGLVQWNDNYYCLSCMLKNEWYEYGHMSYKTRYKGGDAPNQVKELLKTRGLNYQCEFLIKSMRDNKWNDLKNVWKTINAQTTPENVAEQFCRLYEKPHIPSAHLLERRSKAKEFYDYYNESDRSRKAQPDKKPKEDIYKALYEAVQKTINSSKRPFTLAKMEKWGADILMFKQADDKTDKLPLVFDILLNQYYKYVQKLWWVSPSEDFKSNPIHIDVIPSQKPKLEDRTVLAMVTQQVNKAPSLRFGNNPSAVNESLLKSIYKKYKGVNKEIPQFDNPDIFKGIEVQSCNTVDKDNGKYSSDGGGKVTAGKIANWDVEKAVNWLICASTASSQRLCALAVQQAVVAGGIICETGDGYKKIKPMLNSKHWECVASGKTETREISGLNPQIGDIIGMTRGDDFEYCGHICMYCGSQYGWISDYKQYNQPYVYVKKDRPAGTYWMIRYKGGAKSTSATPIRCLTSKGKTKCLNKCPT